VTPNRREAAASGRGSDPRGLPASLADLPWELPRSFLGLDEQAAAFATARAVILPVPYEATTSWGGGTRLGPRALIEASRYVELWDTELGLDASVVGVHTLPALELTREGPGPAMAELEHAYAAVADAAGDRFRIMLGGEHSVSSPCIRATAARLDERPTVLQFDAHADLRPEYEGTPDSHASAMARVLDVADVVAVGIRGISEEEVEVARAHDGVHLIYADAMWDSDAWMDEALERLRGPVYITFDVDYLDPSLMPSTGTPEPGGGDWYRTLRFLRRVFEAKHVVAADVVELAPLPGLNAPDFLAARLVYKMIAYRFAEQLSASRNG